MTIEEKAKAYDEAIERAKKFHTPESNNSNLKAVLELIFPKLEESEDERIMGCIGVILTDATEQRFTDFGISLKDCLAWLERQKEQKSVYTVKKMWGEMRHEVYAQASGNRHEPNYSDDSTKMFSLCDIDEIFEKIGNATIGSRPAEWSEEDERMRTEVLKSLSAYADHVQYTGFCANSEVIRSELMGWLKSLRPQPQWKPSEEQMEALEKTTRLANFGTDAKRRDALLSLYEQLKKLM